MCGFHPVAYCLSLPPSLIQSAAVEQQLHTPALLSPLSQCWLQHHCSCPRTHVCGVCVSVRVFARSEQPFRAFLADGIYTSVCLCETVCSGVSLSVCLCEATGMHAEGAESGYSGKLTQLHMGDAEARSPQRSSVTRL